ncbi:hypothetical protein HDV00_010662 [Rhizophlyctis rosea]|nr:hypothetical protein HDV00_010662 [Rhizophlyctis rosea]
MSLQLLKARLREYQRCKFSLPDCEEDVAERKAAVEGMVGEENVDEETKRVEKQKLDAMEEERKQWEEDLERATEQLEEVVEEIKSVNDIKLMQDPFFRKAELAANHCPTTSQIPSPTNLLSISRLVTKYPCPLSPADEEPLKEQLEMYLEAGYIAKAPPDCKWTSPILIEEALRRVRTYCGLYSEEHENCL